MLLAGGALASLVRLPVLKEVRSLQAVSLALEAKEEGPADDVRGQLVLLSAAEVEAAKLEVATWSPAKPMVLSARRHLLHHRSAIHPTFVWLQ